MDTKDHILLLVEEWKKNVDLHVHHDNLKQQRFRHFIGIQAFLFTVFALTMRENVNKSSMFLGIIAALAPILAVILCRASLVLDRRARDYSSVVKRNLRYIENKIWHRSRLAIFETYAIQYHSLYSDLFHLEDDPAAKLAPALVAKKNPKAHTTASAYEQWMISMFLVFWIAAEFLAVAAIWTLNLAGWGLPRAWI